MRTRERWFSRAASVALLALLAGSPHSARAQGAAPAVSIGSTDLGGTVTSANGPEAGVWVIAETTDLPTKYAKIVVTDEQGRYVMPDLPQSNYRVWVRGYGLVDSAKVQTAPGKIVDLKAVVAPNAAAAAQYYPAIYWYAMLKIPDKSQFPGTGPKGNGMATNVRSQAQWLAQMKNLGCYGCHQLGNLATRTIPASFGHFNNGAEAWERRIQSGQASTAMVTSIGRIDAQRAFALFGDWTDRIAKGELPASKPARPQGVERDVVLTIWDWAGPKNYLHDEVSTDRRDPTVNGYGLIYGTTEESTDTVPILDPVHNVASSLHIPVRDPKTPSAKDAPILASSAYWGDEAIWDAQTTTHNPMIDEKGRVWYTARIRPPETPAWCRAGSDHPSAKLFPIEKSGRQLAMYDPKTKKVTLIDTCFQTHHLEFDKKGILWTSAGVQGSDVVGWLDVNKFDATGDEQKSQGWTALIVDTNGNGKRDDYVEPNQPVDATKDKRLRLTYYAVSPSPADGTIWGTAMGVPGAVVRLDPGSNPPATALAEIYELPLNDPKAPIHGFGPRGMNIDRDGVVWVPLASGHIGAFDRRKCEGPLNGPDAASGKSCPEGWTLYPMPGPQFQGLDESGSAEASYYTWVDQWNTGGLGENVPMATGNGNEGVLALVNGKWVVLRVPYPLGFFAKGMDGRIDDPNAGWKGRGLWATYGTRAPFHIEGGKGTTSKVVHFQIRPDPLAR
jgi:hypothetical protein